MAIFDPFLAIFGPFGAFFGPFWGVLEGSWGGVLGGLGGGPGGVLEIPPFWAFLGYLKYGQSGGIMLPRVSRSFLSEPVAAGLSAATLGCEGGTRRSRQPDRARFGCLFRLLME